MSSLDSPLGSLDPLNPVDADEALNVSSSGYDGPLHALLDLARRQKVDLLQISITELADQYLEFIRSNKAERVDLAAEFLLMAAWLTLLKSRLLLPTPEKQTSDEEVTSEDMAALLAFRLKRLEAMRMAVEALEEGPKRGKTVFVRGMPQHPKITPVCRYQADLWGVVSAIGRVKARKEKEKPHTIAKQYVLPLEDARKSLWRFSRNLIEWASLSDAVNLIEKKDGMDWPEGSSLASLFSASLELTRDGEIDIKQDYQFGPILVKALEDDGTVAESWASSKPDIEALKRA